jgi:hypothetical protein
MALLTIFCGKCGQIRLEEQRQLLATGLRCSRCDAALGVVPGCTFSEEDRILFEDLKQVVAERTIPAPEARGLALDIAGVLRAGTDHGLLERLTSRLPGLVPVQIAAGKNRAARQRALKVLRAIFEAKALGH